MVPGVGGVYQGVFRGMDCMLTRSTARACHPPPRSARTRVSERARRILGSPELGEAYEVTRFSEFNLTATVKVGCG